jgi:Ca2+/Na+ antiporter
VLGPDALLFALVTGVGVVGITLLGDRLGGRLGGLLATAPVTTSAAHVLIATSVPPDLAAGRVLQGVAAMLAGTFGIVAFFYAVKYTRGRPSNARLAAGLAVYVSVFLGLTFLFATFPLHPVSAFVILFATHAALAFTFMREPVPVLQEAATPRRPRRGPVELAGRFAAGAAVVLFAGALAVVPAVFLVSLTVMGVSHDAPFAARAAQAGLFGTTAVAVFVLTIAAGLHLRAPGGIWPLLPVGWAAYALTLAALGRLHGRIAR